MKVLLSLLALFQFTISVDVDLAVFNVSVLDKHGHAVSGLTLGNFHIYEDGREQAIKIFQPEDTPATVGLVIDNSGSMANRREDVIASALAFANASQPDDEMFVVDFNGHAWLALPDSLPFTHNTPVLRSALLATGAEGTTALYDALKLALNHLQKGMHQRKALVLLSDGADNASHTTLDEILHLAEESSATIYCIGIYDQDAHDRDPRSLKKIAKLTGGEAYFPQHNSDLRDLWPRIAGAIRGQYTIGYLPSNAARDGAYRRVKIIAADSHGKTLAVRARQGYYAAQSKP